MRMNKFIKSEQSGKRDGDHVCGLLVQARPDRLDTAVAGLSALPGVEIHHRGEDGRMIVTVEDTAEATAGEVMHRFSGVEGVISTALVYHYHDTGDEGEAFT